MSFDLHSLAHAVQAHGPVTRVVIARLTGSSPREVGAHMYVWNEGQSGSIGGGNLEFEATKLARAGHIGAVDFPLGPTLGQCCGGHVTLAFERFGDAASLPPAGNTYTRQIEGTSPQPKFKGTHVQYKDGWLSEPMHAPALPVWLWGAGHVGRAVAEVIHDIPGLAVTWADVSEDRFPNMSEDITPITAPNLPELVKHAPPHAAHFIFTYAHETDLELCHRILQNGHSYCGMIGSKTKWAKFKSRLSGLGHDAAQIDRINCPIGDPALGKHPKMIALGVAQGLISLRRDGVGIIT